LPIGIFTVLTTNAHKLKKLNYNTWNGKYKKRNGTYPLINVTPVSISIWGEVLTLHICALCGLFNEHSDHINQGIPVPYYLSGEAKPCCLTACRRKNTGKLSWWYSTYSQSVLTLFFCGWL